MWKSKSPPLMVVLLWHHICYYKRHKLLFAISILLPFILMGFMMIIIWQLNSTSTSGLNRPLRYNPAEQQTTSLLSSGLLQYVQGGYSCYQTDTIKPDCPSGYICAEGNASNPLYYTDKSLLDYILNDTGISSCPYSSLDDLDCSQLFQHYLYKYDPSLALMMGWIVYYPNNSGSVAESIMGLVRERLESYKTFAGTNQPLNTPTNFPSVWNSLAKYANISKCWIELSARVKGFASRDDLLAFTQTNLANQSITDENSKDLVPLLWGAINFDGTDQAYQTKKFSYSLMHETGSSTLDNKDIWLQDLIEEAAVRLFSNYSNQTNLPISVTLKELPQKCWIKPNSYAFSILLNYFPTAITIGFMLMPVTLLGQLITEKYLRLGEYLHIMGVSDFMLKLSWILFYALLLLPISFLCALLIYFTPPNIFSLTDASIFFVIFVSFNLSQLCWCYFLCSVMVNPTKVRLVITFVNVFLSVFSFNTYNFAAGELNGAFLVIIRLLSLQASTPFNLAICYLINWESIWIGAEWSYFFYSPNKGDGYNGFGECILWMLGDSVLYLILGWYLKHVMPGLFGVKYPWYFFLTSSYWCPKHADDDNGSIERSMPVSQSRADMEPDLPNRVPGIVLQNLTKKYVKNKAAVDNLTITFNKNEITAFLGENGAGKTTTMNILVGIINATSGVAKINGMNVAKHMNEIRKIIGFVPQYDILYPDLNVEEHIQFYGWLKGLSTEQIWSKMNVLLKRLELDHVRKVIATRLSGGQKRKLSILSAYIGNPEVVILDEPTSGVDPFSRRSIWDLISLYRKSSTTILSTHFMDEADMLGDRIAIISTGNLICVGSGMYLKNHYGQGYRITVAMSKDSSGDASPIQNFLNKQIPDIKLVHESGVDKTFAVPINNAQSSKIIDLLENFEMQKEKLGVIAFGVSEPTLEDVFFTATGALKKNGSSNYGATLQQNSTNVHKDFKHLTGFMLLWTQFIALVKKRVWITFQQRSVVIMQTLLPLAFVGVMILIGGGWGTTSSSQKAVDFYQVYRQNVFFFQDHNGMGQEFLSAASKYGLNPNMLYSNNDEKPLIFPNTSYPLSGSCTCGTYCTANGANEYDSTVVPSNDKIYALDSAANLTEWVILANQSSHWIIGGFEFFQMTNNVYDLNNEITNEYDITNPEVLNKTTTLNYTVIWTTPDTNAANLNAFNNLLIRYLGTNFSIILNSETANLAPPTQNENTQIISAISSATTCYFLIMAYIFASFGLADFLQMEKIMGLKQMQFIAGAKPATYWCANLFWDLVQFAFVTGSTFILLGLIKNLFQNDLLNLLLILMPFAVGSMSFTYLMTFFFNSAAGFNRLVNLSALLFQVLASIIGVFNVVSDEAKYVCQVEGENPCQGVVTWVTAVSCILCLIPYYNLAESITYIALVRTLANYNYVGQNTDASGAFANLLQFNILGRRIMEAWLVAVFFFLLVLLKEYRKRSKTKLGSSIAPAEQQYQELVDADVLEEEQKVMSAENLNDPLVVKKVFKLYPKQQRPAVNGVSFSIPRGQCFGLLGINGAGKTSLFKILAGFQPANSGTALVESLDINLDWQKIGHYMSYCPQQNTLFYSLTPERHLKLFGSLRGLAKDDLNAEVERLIKQVGLENNKNTVAFFLSGGNQRKLQFALALLDYRPLIFLDEPTTGMDPAARRLAWNSISDAIARGCSIVLTSHSMEECEELCHRLVIMVLGNFACIGSVQYLKDKIGNTYTFKIKLTPDMDNESIAKIKEHFDNNLPGVVLSEEHGSLLIFEIPASHVKVSHLFKLLTQSAQQFKGLIEDFSISQISLERVFINMAERQEMRKEQQ